MDLEQHIKNLKDYIRIDKDNIAYDDSDSSQFCKSHCEDIQAVLEELNNRIPISEIEKILEAVKRQREKEINELGMSLRGSAVDILEGIVKEYKNKE